MTAKTASAIGGLVTALAVAWPVAAPANSLMRIYRLALEHDAQFAAAQAAYQAGQEAWPQARAAVLPTISAFASYAETEREVVATPFSGSRGAPSASGPPTPPFTDEFGSEAYGIELRQPIFNWGIPATLRQGEARVDIATLEYRKAQKLLLVRASKAFLNYLQAEATLELTLAEQRAIASALERTRGRYEVGEVSITALREAQAALDLAQSRIISARAALDQAREALRLITTVWFEDLPGFDEDIATVPPQPRAIEDWVDIALDYNAQYLAAIRRAEVAEDQIQLERADYIPDVDLVASYQDNDQTEFVFGGASNDTTVALEATWVLFAGGRSRSEVREAQALYRQAFAELEAARRQVVADTRNAFREVLTLIQRNAALEQAVKSARIALKSIQAEFKFGSRTQADVIDARRDLFAALIEETQSSYDYLTAVLVLKANAGILAPDDIAAVDAQLGPEGPAAPEPGAPPASEATEMQPAIEE